MKDSPCDQPLYGAHNIIALKQDAQPQELLMSNLQQTTSSESESSTTTELALAQPELPGAAVVDSVLLDQAVATINSLFIGKGLELYFAVGEYVLSTFFDGDPENFHARGKGHATFRALGAREDLRLSHSALYKAVAVVEQRHMLPENLSSVLSFEHQVMLLPVKDVNEKVELARRAALDGLSSRTLSAEVKRLKENQRKGVRLGRPNLPGFVKALGRLRKIREQAAAEPIDMMAFTNISHEKARVFLSDVEHWIHGLQETLDQARAALDAASMTSGPRDEAGADQERERD